MTVEEFFDGVPLGLKVHERVCALLDKAGIDYTTRVSKSQVAFRRKRGFAYLWKPGLYLRHAAADVVLSIALDRELKSKRFKEVTHPARTSWMHHLEIRRANDIDDEVATWLHEAAERAAG